MTRARLRRNGQIGGQRDRLPRATDWVRGDHRRRPRVGPGGPAGLEQGGQIRGAVRAPAQLPQVARRRDPQQGANQVVDQLSCAAGPYAVNACPRRLRSLQDDDAAGEAGPEVRPRRKPGCAKVAPLRGPEALRLQCSSSMLNNLKED